MSAVYRNSQTRERGMVVSLEPFKENEFMTFDPRLSIDQMLWLVHERQRKVVQASVAQHARGGKVFPLEAPKKTL